MKVIHLDLFKNIKMVNASNNFKLSFKLDFEEQTSLISAYNTFKRI